MAGDVGLRAEGRRSQSVDRSQSQHNEKIRVVVRVRPENGMETAGTFRNIIEVVGEEMLVFDPKENGSPSFYHGKARRQRDINKRTCRDMKFAFDRVFGCQESTNTVYEDTTKAILDGLLEGYNCSVFAYGATGAGKTHTMLGSKTDPGVIFLTMMDLFRRIDEIKDEKTCEVAVSYLEVYNEQIRDLLMPGNFLPVREDPNRGVVIAGLSLHKPHSAEELMHMLRLGNSNRTQHPTDANAESSRSHAVFQVYVRQKDRTGNTSSVWNVAKMSLIDLAGSERATVTKNRGQRFREGANINRSLLALGNCINALAEGKSKGYVPYRNSKLTRLLKDSLGGNCRTVMIAAISPSAMTYEDTYNTLKYADRAKHIKVGLKKNVVSVDLHVSRYVKLIEELRAEVSELKGKLEVKEHSANKNPVIPSSQQDRNVYNRLNTSLEDVFNGRVEIRKEMLELEASERDLSFKIYRKELTIKRISLLPEPDTEAQQGLSRFIENAEKRKVNIDKRQKGLEERRKDNDTWLSQVMNEVEKCRPNNPLAELLDAKIRARHLEVELRDMRRQAKYLKRLCRGQEREAQSMEKCNNLLLQTVINQYLLIKAHRIAGHQEVSQYEAVIQMVCQNVERSVAWADQSVCPDDALSTTFAITPGPSSEGEQPVTLHLLDFPVLTTVPVTPQRSRTSNTPRSHGSTPRSARRNKNKRTPSRPFHNEGNHNQSHIPAPNKGTTPRHGTPGILRVKPHGAPALNLYKHGISAPDFRQVVNEDDGVFPLQPTPPANNPASRVGMAPVQGLPHKDSMPQLKLGEAHLIPPPVTVETGQDSKVLNTTQTKISPEVLQISLDSDPNDNSPDVCASPTLTYNPPEEDATKIYQVAMKTGEEEERKDRSRRESMAMNSTYTEDKMNTTVNIASELFVSDQTQVIKNIHMSTCGVPLPVVDTPPEPFTSSQTPPLPIFQSQALNRTPPIPHTASCPPFHTPSPIQPTLTQTQTPSTPSFLNNRPSSFSSSTVTKTVPLQEGENSKTSGVIKSGTVTKAKPMHSGNSTVTKCVHSDVNKENDVAPPQGSVVRSMSFGSNEPSPLASGMSFAEALKSPAPNQFRHLKEAPSVRSPLASRENLPDNNVGTYGRPSLAGIGPYKPSAQRGFKQQYRVSRPHHNNPSTSSSRPYHPGTDTLRRLGLPSVLDRRAAPASGGGSGGGGSGNTPGYMKNTKASSRRYQHHPRSMTSEGGGLHSQFPRRILVNDENVRPAPRRGMARSKSQAALNSRTADPR